MQEVLESVTFTVEGSSEVNFAEGECRLHPNIMVKLNED